MQTYMTTVSKPCRVCHSHMRLKEIATEVQDGNEAWQFLYCQRCGFGPNHTHDHAELQWYETSL